MFLKLLLITICIASNAFADVKVVFSEDTHSFFKNTVLKTCTLPKFNLLELYYGLYTTEIERMGYKPDNNYYLKNLNSYFDEYKCDKKVVSELNKKMNRDLRPAHIEAMKNIKKEIGKFRKKGLSGSAQVAKFLAYKRTHDLLDIEEDQTVIKLEEVIKSASSERKKTCTDVMNLKEPLSLSKPKNQDTIGWCYAFTASDLVAHALGRNPSAMHSAMLTNDKFWYSFFGVKEGGFIDTAINEMIDKGICLERDLPSSDYQFSNYNHDLSVIFKKVLDLSKQYNSTNLLQSYKPSSDEIIKNLCDKDQDFIKSLKKIFPNINLAEFAVILTNGSSNGAFKRIADRSCKATRDNDLKSLEVKTETAKKKIFPTLDDQLNKGNILGIHYKSNVLSDYKENTWFSDHASSIVGRRFNSKTNSCEYLLRNSWGGGCSLYSSDYECNNGHVWIGEEFFKYNNAITEVVYVQKN